MEKWKTNYLDRTSAAAEAAGHIFPTMASCEAALESGFGTSILSIQDHNEFGMKQHQHPVYGTHSLPTKEFINSEWVVVDANWISYPDEESCFKDRMTTLIRLASVYPNYAAAIAATDATTYVTSVSKTWSTDPNRAAKVLSIYTEYMNVE